MNPLLQCLCLAVTSALLLAPTAHAEPAYPVRPVRILVGFSPGGSNDIVARLLAPKLSEALGQQVLIDNRPGAGGSIAADSMLKAPADGHTLMICTTGLLTIQPLLQKPGYDPRTDIVPVSLIANTPYIALANAALPIRSVPELIAYAKAHPGELHFASSGNGTMGHLAGEMLKLRAGIHIVHVPYKGTGQAMTDLIGGQVSLIFDQPISSLAYAKSGKLRVLGVAALQRLQSLPEVPTFAEAGLPGFDPVAWTGLCAAKGTPAHVLARLHLDLVQVLRQSEIAQRLVQDGMQVVGSSPDEFREFLVAERRKWAAVIKEVQLRLE
ncbi:tripartite tricarboxylate transporter substrate binding protein [Verminephrobacter aporrectodeae subsp. tuberculatae]|uniref:Bug family tripartite tricarboxylate transporter substrate binding protein n=1 Tax=Verminephrobacter aporrectodeae TaxID=1110389 RepID=UPI0022377FF0|nr:tripartite tricarboxylate transporter substrate binding protein [Verminephrobacter aporrectodeae]MCW5258554.1 tripartite tricarboxylate transporter substrate binding protein [Verminephrobacter aporrectodeae subsp. tuberculatae]